MTKNTCQPFVDAFKLLTLYFLFTLSNSQIVCQLNPNCFDGCSDSTCVYDPSTNPFYNSFLPNTTDAYNGPFCCLGCNSGYFLWMDMKTCSQACNLVTEIQTFGNPLTRTCGFMCPDLYLGDPISTKCVTKCPSDYWASFFLNKCVLFCPTNTPFHYTTNMTCIEKCQNGNFSYIGTSGRNMCSPQCPITLFSYQNNMSCIKQCPNGFYGYLVTGNCVQQCPYPTFKHPDSKLCETKCFGNFPYGDQTTNACVKTCPIDSSNKTQKYGDNTTATCVQTCPSGSFAHPDTYICVKKCFGNFSVSNNTTNQCEVMLVSQSSGSTLPKISLVIIISVISGSILVLIVSSILVYKFYVKKRLVRKPWKYDILKDIQFSL